VHNDYENIIRIFQVNPFYRLGDMEKTSLFQEAALTFENIVCG